MKMEESTIAAALERMTFDLESSAKSGGARK